ncbi:MAG: flavodoxin [Bacteroides sp.]|nr:flavodoxin [Bacteroides sp.]MCM1388814.1 flavodoxin [Bacteroides sp.]
MKKYLYLLVAVFLAVGMSACSPDDNEPDGPQTEVPENPGDPDNGDDGDEPGTPDNPDGGDEPETPDNPNPDPENKTLIVYYSFSNNVHTIVNDLKTQIEADVVMVEPAEEGLDYAANNYAIGSALIQAIRNNPNDASSYPAIKPVEVNIADYDRIIVGAPLWWSNMAAPLQTFLFQHGAEMADKQIGLIVSSASSGIGGVESDAKRLIPEGNFLSPSLWIRSSQTSNCHSLIADWLDKIK